MHGKIEEIAVFISARETHNRKNVHKSVAQTLSAFEETVLPARAAGLRVRGYVSTVWGCAYEGDVDPARYGEAATLDVYGREDGLPPALSGHNQYWLWGPRGYDGSLAINIGGDADRWRRICGSVDVVDKTSDPYAMPYENNRSIFICRDLRIPVAQLWGRLKRFR